MHTKMKKSISILLVVCVVLSLFAGSAYATHRYFEDAKGHWAEDAIQILSDKGVLCGYPDGLSHPDEIITRAEFSVLVARTLELPEPDEQDVTIRFTDLAGHWSEKDVEALIIAGMIQKDDFGSKFLPDEPITRMEMIRMLVRAIGKGEHDSACPCDIGFLDESQLTEGQKAYLCTGKHYHIISGYPDGTVRPDGDATRGEAFEMLVDTAKAKEQIKKEEPQKPPVVKPEDKPSGGGSGGGGSSYVPAPQFSFTLPKTAYTSEEIEVKPTSRYVSEVVWSALKNSLPMELSEVIKGELTASGGKVSFAQTGSITLIATAKNSRGVTVTQEQTVSIYPVVKATFTLPDTAHTDTAVAVELKTENLDGNPVTWSVKHDGKEIAIADAMEGTLSAEGGTVVFKEKGNYTLTVSIADELGKAITAEDSITVYPVAEVKLTLPTVSHTDKTVPIKAETKNVDGLEVSYALTKNGESVEIGTVIAGSIADETICFKEKGVYALTASVTDATGRVFADTASITVYPVGSAGFYLPEIFHTDKTIMVEAVFGEIGSHTANWSLNAEALLIAIASAAIIGELYGKYIAAFLGELQLAAGIGECAFGCFGECNLFAVTLLISSNLYRQSISAGYIKQARIEPERRNQMKALKNESAIYVNQIAAAITECYEASANPSNSELMELYCFMGQCICQQGEKAFVVHLAEALAAQLPQLKGFSPRNLRRMRDFYRTYINSPSLMAKAIKLGWTQNTIILECCETNEQRSFYIGLTSEKNLSKLALMKAIKENTFASTQSTTNCATDVSASFAPVSDIDTEQSVDTAATIEAACGASVPACEAPRQGTGAYNSFSGIATPETNRLTQSRPPDYQANRIKTWRPLLLVEQHSQAQRKTKVIHIRGQTPSDASREIFFSIPKAG